MVFLKQKKKKKNLWKGGLALNIKCIENMKAIKLWFLCCICYIHNIGYESEQPLFQSQIQHGSPNLLEDVQCFIWNICEVVCYPFWKTSQKEIIQVCDGPR